MHNLTTMVFICSAQLDYVTLASTSSKPAPAKQTDFLKPTSDHISAIQEFREKNRSSPFFNHLSAISESIPALGWVCVVCNKKKKNIINFCLNHQTDLIKQKCNLFLFRAQHRLHMSRK